MMDAVLLVDKPSGMTSFGVVARLRRVLSLQTSTKVKVGHTGTLDPFATGLMIIVVGKECRNAAHYTKLDKIYEATIKLGCSSTTGDPEGAITSVAVTSVPTIECVQEILRRFIGDIVQRPPAFSAIKIHGQRAYALARNGVIPDMPSRTVTIYSLELLSYAYPLLTIRAHVSSGTYIRSLAVDIGKALGTGAYCQTLRRTQISDWRVNSAKHLADFGIND